MTDILEKPLVIILDDDKSIREALADLFASVDIDTVVCASFAELEVGVLQSRLSCLVLDVRLPGTNGLKVQECLKGRGIDVPIVFITGHADVAMTVKAMKAGAMDFLAKPLRDQDVLDAVAEAIEKQKAFHRRRQAIHQLAHLAKNLTPREVDVVKAVGRGLLNKQIAHELGIGEPTVKMHRGMASRKLGAISHADLVIKARAIYPL